MTDFWDSPAKAPAQAPVAKDWTDQIASAEEFGGARKFASPSKNVVRLTACRVQTSRRPATPGQFFIIECEIEQSTDPGTVQGEVRSQSLYLAQPAPAGEAKGFIAMVAKQAAQDKGREVIMNALETMPGANPVAKLARLIVEPNNPLLGTRLFVDVYGQVAQTSGKPWNKHDWRVLGADEQINLGQSSSSNADNDALL